jgi:hypothetical protein
MNAGARRQCLDLGELRDGLIMMPAALRVRRRIMLQDKLRPRPSGGELPALVLRQSPPPSYLRDPSDRKREGEHPSEDRRGAGASLSYPHQDHLPGCVPPVLGTVSREARHEDTYRT